MKVLIIDDDRDLCASVALALNHESIVVDFAYDSEQGFHEATSSNGHKYDVIILDNNLPKQNGLTLCARLRAHNITTPILVLSINASEDIKVNFLDTGADDYVSKPFSARELSARLRALVRRPHQLQSKVISIGELILDSVQQLVTYKNHTINLPRKQYLILEYFLLHPNQIITRETLAEHVWNDPNLNMFSNALEAHICELRKRLRLHTSKNFIHTLIGRGYRFTPKT